jgi:hypothetical protein
VGQIAGGRAATSFLCIVGHFYALQRVATDGKISVLVKKRENAHMAPKFTAISKTMKRSGRVISSQRLLLGGHLSVINIKVLEIIINRAPAKNCR